MLDCISWYTWSILTSTQRAMSACLYVEHVIMAGGKGFCSFMDAIRFYYHCLVDERMSRWVSTHFQRRVTCVMHTCSVLHHSSACTYCI